MKLINALSILSISVLLSTNAFCGRVVEPKDVPTAVSFINNHKGSAIDNCTNVQHADSDVCCRWKNNNNAWNYGWVASPKVCRSMSVGPNGEKPTVVSLDQINVQKLEKAVLK